MKLLSFIHQLQVCATYVTAPGSFNEERALALHYSPRQPGSGWVEACTSSIP